MVVVNGRPLKRMKRRVTADLYNFLTFPSGDEPRRYPFLTTIRSFLAEHALLPHPSCLFPHLLTWQISFRVGDDVVEGGGGAARDDGSVGSEVVCLDVVEEDVARSRSVYCDHCRVVGWSGHPVCGKRYHFIIKADGNTSVGYHMPCTCCGDMLHLSELRCKTCNHVATADDVEDWVYNQLEVSTHLLHGIVHANGYGHLLRVNGREGGSRFLSGYQIMDFWDRLCKTLGVRKISVMDVSKKYGLEYRLLHAVTRGRSWYGEWGYEFGAGSFGLTVDLYKSAIETLSSLPLSNFIPQGRKPHTLLQDVILFYQSLSEEELVNIKDLFSYVLSLICKAQKSSSKVDGSTYKKRLVYPTLAVSPSWVRADIECVEEAMCKVLRAVTRSRWVSWRALRGAICKTAPADLLDYCLKELGGKQTADGMFVSARCNPDSGALEYRLEPGSASSTGQTYTSASSVVTCPSEEKLVQDLKFLFDSILNPLTMVSYGTGSMRELAVSAGEKLLDCKQFLKNYKPEKMILSTNPHVICLSCEVEVVDLLEESVPNPPPEIIILPHNATISDLKCQAAKAFQDIYLLFRRFQIEEVCGFRGVDDSTQVKLLLGTAESVCIRGRCLVKNGLGKYKMERGTDRWTVECSCGAKDDDGERMLACDACGVWQHTRCSGIADSESVPAKFVCYKCRGRGMVNKLFGVAHG